MTVKLFNLARVVTSSSGSSTIVLGNAVPGCLTFAQAGVQNGDEISYGIINSSQSEVGRGIYGASGSTLTRSVLKSTNNDLPIVLAGNSECFITGLAEDFVSSIAGSSIMSDSSGSIIKHNSSSFSSLAYYRYG